MPEVGRIRIVTFGDITSIIDMEKKVMMYKGREIRIPENASISPGDTIEFEGKKGAVTEYNPSYYATVAEKRTQTIKPADYAFMIAMSGIRPGSIVLESGIGSGQLSAAILWAIGDQGSLVSVDTSDENAMSSKRNLSKFQGTDRWKVVNADVKTFTTEILFDAAFLDIPDPWECAPSMKKLIRSGGSLVTYSPNFNQTEKTVVSMEEHGFSHQTTCEILKRDILVRPGRTRPSSEMLSHTAFISFFLLLSGFQTRIG